MQFGQIYLAIWTNKFGNSDKYIFNLQLPQEREELQKKFSSLQQKDVCVCHLEQIVTGASNKAAGQNYKNYLLEKSPQKSGFLSKKGGHVYIMPNKNATCIFL